MFVLYFFKLKPILIFNFLILYTILEPTWKINEKELNMNLICSW
jgi:hypothetical protein